MGLYEMIFLDETGNDTADGRLHHKRANISVRIYDTMGHLVNTLSKGEIPSGEHRVRWNGQNSQGLSMASGTYFLKIEAGSELVVRPMTLLK